MLWLFGGRVTAYSRPPRGGRGLKSGLGHVSVYVPICRPPRGGRGLKYIFRVPTYYLLCRPPRGGRGLKFSIPRYRLYDGSVAPLAGGVD